MQQTIPVNDATISSYVGTVPSTGPFQVDFPFFSLNDVIVTRQDDGAPVETLLVRGADYDLAGVATEDGSFSSGTVTLVIPVTNTTIRRFRQTPVERLSNFPLQGFFSRLALNAELNRITVWMQEALGGVAFFFRRALRVPEDGTGVVADNADNRKGRVLAWDNDGNLIHSTAYLVDIEAATGSGSISSIIVGPAPPPVSAPGQLWFWTESAQGGGTLYISYDDGNSTQWVPCAPNGSDLMLQVVSTSSSAVATGTGFFPQDDTIPQVDEGTEFMNLTMIPRLPTSRLIIDVTWIGSAALTSHMVVGLFKDSGVDALAVAITQTSTNQCVTSTFRHVMTSGFGPTTFRVRAGATGPTTTTFNGTAGARLFGGTLASSISIQEVL